MGWDTVDELLTKYYGWKVVTDMTLIVKHLKPTRLITTKRHVTKQGETLHARLQVSNYGNSFN
jgi:hypothetical protein